jgi:cellobiose-specific phosphotransferase system component IIC
MVISVMPLFLNASFPILVTVYVVPEYTTVAGMVTSEDEPVYEVTSRFVSEILYFRPRDVSVKVLPLFVIAAFAKKLLHNANSIKASCFIGGKF